MKAGREDGQKGKGGDKRERKQSTKGKAVKKRREESNGGEGGGEERRHKEKQLTLSGEPQTLAGVHIAPALQRKMQANKPYSF